MKLLKIINQGSVRLLFLAAILLVAAQIGDAQITIEIPKIKRPAIPKIVKPMMNNETTTDNAETNSTTENPTAAKNGDEPPEWWLNVMISDINKAKEEVDLYTNAAERLYLVSTPSSPWLLRAVSPKAREEFAKDKKFDEWRVADKGNKFDAALDALNAAAAKKLPAYIPNAKNFALHDAALEKMMKAKLKNAATLKIHKIGIFDANWRIEKNDAGIPVNRYREAYIWGKDSADDYQYCHLYGIVLQQDYAGGGSYGATWAYVNTDSLFGCP
jgi:hypothetical protein